MKRQTEAIKLAQAFLGFVWLLAIVISVFSGGSTTPFFGAGVLSILPIAGLAYFRYRQSRPGSSPR